MATEQVMFSPLPRKALETPHSLPTSPVPCSPSEGGVLELHTVRPFWFSDGDEDAAQELRTVLGYQTPTKVLPEWLPAFDAGCLSEASTMAPTSPPPPSCLSEASTMATSPPPPSGISPPSSPDHVSDVSPDLDDGIGSPTRDHQPRCSPGANDKSSWLQARKVFVGGIPQNMDQSSLYNIFSKIGKVKKAWLQLFHTEHSAGRVVTTKKHRGFGFVIFYEKHSIDRLLGDDSSRFVTLENDVKFEVKRAIGKTSVQPSAEGSLPQKAARDKQPSAEGSKMPEMAASQASPAPTGSQGCASPPASQSWQNCPSPSPPASQHCASPAVLQNWQSSPNQAFLVTVQTFNLPHVPQFPFAQAAAMQIPVANTPLTAMPFQVLPSVTSVGPASFCNFVPVVGQKPFNPQELKQALLDAMPDHYDD